LNLIIYLICITGALATVGVDLSQECTDFTCLYNEGFRYAIIRAWMSSGEPDPVGPHTIYNAWAGGMEDVDVYFFPCFSCGDPAGQVQSAVANLQSYSDQYGMMWFDIEGPGVYWGDSQSDNANFFQALIDEANNLGVKFGVYTSASQWIPIMGGYTGGSAYPLWYAHYDGDPSFDDFSAFGGWNSPAIKQYQGSTNICGCGVDYNWYPD